ncbi:hypothetical protein [Dyella japonica]|uniref:Uncharacterized protein n=1 Tax=Dyella japonica DSM 16301 TaxID=1440762 RepID=A0A0G9HCC8_9GAMM|nr:hypothetical protein [Dyella japonica]KLD65357.1 hypothetical protein Y882_03520 [Dyella japonica DSM 16301]
MTLAPLRQHDEIWRRISVLEVAVSTGEPLNEVVWHGIKRDLLQLQKVPSEASASFASFAYIQIFRGGVDVDEYVKCARRAIADPKLPHQSYFQLLSSAARIAEPKMFDEVLAAALSRNVPVPVKLYVACVMQLGRLRDAASQILAYPKDFEKADTIWGADEVVEAATYLASLGVSDEMLEARVNVAAKTLMRLSERAVHNSVIEPTASGVIFGMPSPSNDQMRADFDLAITEALIDNFEEPLFDAVSFLVYPIDLFQTFLRLNSEGKTASGLA